MNRPPRELRAPGGKALQQRQPGGPVPALLRGNFMTREELVKLSMNDIQNRMMNREGKELSNVHIPRASGFHFCSFSTTCRSSTRSATTAWK